MTKLNLIKDFETRMKLLAEDEGGEGGGGNPSPDNPPAPPDVPQDWVSGVNEEFKPFIEKYGGDLNKMIGSHVSADSMIGKKGLIVPADDATAEDWEKFHEQWGVPKDIKDYGDFEGLPEVPAEFKEAYDKKLEERMPALKEAMAKAGLNKRQAGALAKELIGLDLQIASSAIENQQKQTAEAFGNLQKEWGVNEERNFGRAKQVLDWVDSDKTFADLDLKANPQFSKLLFNISKKFSESSFVSADSNGGAGIPGTRGEAQARIDAFVASEEGKAVFDPSHPNHKNALAKYNEFLDAKADFAVS